MPDIALHGAKELRSALLEMDATVRGPLLRTSVYRAATRIRYRARQLAPRRTGLLIRKISVYRRRANPMTGTAVVRAGAPHAHLIEFGHRVVRGRRGGSQRVVGHVPPQEFLRPAFDAESGRAAAQIMDELWGGVSDAWRKRMGRP